jgi:hypothetical protein
MENLESKLTGNKIEDPIVTNFFKIVSYGTAIFTGINSLKSIVSGNYDGAALCAGATAYFGVMGYQLYKQAEKLGVNENG